MEKIIKQIKKEKKKKSSLKKIPETPGVYLFLEKNTPLYVGKAINLRSRLASYFSKNLFPKTRLMVEEAQMIGFIKVASEIEALLLEAKLIKAFRPRYNIELKDDKYPLYIRITGDEYPRVITARKNELEKNDLAHFGPFPSSTNVRNVLKLIRRVFPFAEHLPTKRKCFFAHIGLCNPCPSLIEAERRDKEKKAFKKEYLANIRKVKGILSGRVRKIEKDMETKMKNYARKESFEKAIILRDKLQSLSYITGKRIPSTSFLSNPNLMEDIRKREEEELRKILLPTFSSLSVMKRIECYDVAHIAGVSPTASMVTTIDGEIDKSFYRHFRINQKKGKSDTDSLAEVAARRAKYFKKEGWGKPDLIIVDGGKGQVSSFLKSIAKDKIPIVGIAKREEKLIIPTKEGFREVKLKGPALNLVQRLRNEAHRFARRYHHQLIAKSFITR